MVLDLIQLGVGRTRSRDRGLASLFEVLKAKPDLVNRCVYVGEQDKQQIGRASCRERV